MELDNFAACVENDADRDLEFLVSLSSILVWAGLAEINPNNLKAIADHEGFVSLSPASYCPLVVNIWLGADRSSEISE